MILVDSTPGRSAAARTTLVASLGADQSVRLDPLQAPAGATPVVGDFNGDGRDDIVWYRAGSGCRRAVDEQGGRRLDREPCERERHLPPRGGRLRWERPSRPPLVRTRDRSRLDLDLHGDLARLGPGRGERLVLPGGARSSTATTVPTSTGSRAGPRSAARSGRGRPVRSPAPAAARRRRPTRLESRATSTATGATTSCSTAPATAPTRGGGRPRASTA